MSIVFTESIALIIHVLFIVRAECCFLNTIETEKNNVLETEKTVMQLAVKFQSSHIHLRLKWQPFYYFYIHVK